MSTTGGGEWLLTRAVHNKDSETVKRLVAEGAFDSEGEDTCRAFGIAAAWGLIDVIELLLDAGVSPDCHDEHQVTALMLAARAGQPRTSRLLVRRGAGLETQDVLGRTPLIYSVQGGCVESTTVLLESGANPLVRDRKGRSPLYYARRRPLLNFEIPKWVPLVGGFSVFGLTYRLRGSSALIEILEKANQTEGLT